MMSLIWGGQDNENRLYVTGTAGPGTDQAWYPLRAALQAVFECGLMMALVLWCFSAWCSFETHAPL